MKKSQIIKELREKDVKALTKELSLSQDKLVKLRSDLAFRKLKNVKEVMKTRHYIANIWTILNEKAVQAIEKQEVTK